MEELTEGLRQEFSKERYLKYHSDQFEEPKRSTIHLRSFLERVVGREREEQVSVLDIACGGGANMYHLAPSLPNSSWTGIDLVPKYFELAEGRLDPSRFRLLEGDMFQLVDLFGAKSFDISFCVQTILDLPDYEKAVSETLDVTTRWVFLTALFNDSNLDYITHLEVTDRTDLKEDDVSAYYNVYSLPRFKEFCLRSGAAEILDEEFSIDIDLEPPADGSLGTYTIRKEDGTRLQVSGPLVMPWRAVAIRLR